MPSAKVDAFDRAHQTSHAWLATVADELDTEDRRFALRALRAWLHTVRDRLSVDSAAKFAAQLPELLRGIYYDGWEPNRVPIRYGQDEFVTRFAFEARMRTDEVRDAAPAVAAALSRHFSGGLLAEVLAQLPHDLRELIAGQVFAQAGSTRRAPAETRPVRSGPDRGRNAADRLAQIESRLDTLADAVELLARGLQESPQEEPDPERASRSARLASELLMAGRR